jgi:hypothetical protein
VVRVSPAHAAQVLTVTSTGDSGWCPGGSGLPGYTLRCAIQQANADGSGDGVVFNIPQFDANGDPNCPGSISVCVIQTPGLPPLTADDTAIDGNSQGFARLNTNPPNQPDNAFIQVQIQGIGGNDGIPNDCLSLEGANDRVDGLSLTDCNHSGVEVSGQNDVVEGNFIGVPPDGSAAGNGNGVGVDITGGGAVIGGPRPEDRNVISGNVSNGVLIQIGSQQVIEGNLIGTDITGERGLGNGFAGVVLRPCDSTFTAFDQIGPGNVISGNGRYGIQLDPSCGGFNRYNHIIGNEIGTDASGTLGIGNGSDGVLLGEPIDPSSTGSGLNSFDVIGGPPPDRNVISGNATGVDISAQNGPQAQDNAVMGNYIGTDVTGTKGLGATLKCLITCGRLHPLRRVQAVGRTVIPIYKLFPPFVGDGIVLKSLGAGASVTGTQIGGVGSARNIISNNLVDGILLSADGQGASLNANYIEGNYVGTDLTGTKALGNGALGVALSAQSGAAYPETSSGGVTRRRATSSAATARAG